MASFGVAPPAPDSPLAPAGFLFAPCPMDSLDRGAEIGIMSAVARVYPGASMPTPRGQLGEIRAARVSAREPSPIRRGTCSERGPGKSPARGRRRRHESAQTPETSRPQMREAEIEKARRGQSAGLPFHVLENTGELPSPSQAETRRSAGSHVRQGFPSRRRRDACPLVRSGEPAGHGPQRVCGRSIEGGFKGYRRGRQEKGLRSICG
jgi:hypothetical protein